ncbi:putative fatty acyl-CoA reductase CG5065 isoform X2 [Anticarsia gemmatalis]
MFDDKDSAVASFYSGKSVFLTGGTGFLGKTLIEKLLYSCSGIDKIYVLVRDKNNKLARDRMAKITNSPLFDRLRMSRSKDLNKIIPVVGDITRDDLGLLPDVLKTLEEEVSIVFHLAATVNFNLPLNKALNINVNGTHEVIQLCRRMKKLQAFVHVSTAFSNSDRSDVDEVVYPMPVTYEHARTVAELHSENEDVMKKILGKKPNTYTFSKAFAEELVKKGCNDIPSAIVRPSIVMAALKEPCPGWIDSWNGSTGLFVGMPTGTMKVVIGRGTNVTDLIPVDLVTNLVIVAATKCQKSEDVKVYNCCSGTSNPITCDQATAIAKRVTLKYSLNELPWPMLIFTPSAFLYLVLSFVLQIVPAYIIDAFSLITGKKAMQMKIQSRLRKVVEAVKFFLLYEWKFSDSNVRALCKSLSAKDKEMFNFDVTTINWDTCIQDYVLGARKHLLNLNDSKKIS